LEETTTTSTSVQNNKRIAKNTLMLYFRMILTMLVSLYTSRVVLNTLGVEDYGIYNVVGGVVVMFGFLNSSMASATNRFLSFELGRKDYVRLRNIFSMSVNIHSIIALVIFLLAETVGLWFLNTQLKIPAARFNAAFWVYQFSVLSFMVSIVRVPYNSMIIAHERMNIYAWMSIIEVVLKLLIVYLLLIVSFDKLKLYSALTFLVTLLISVIYAVYCLRKFNEAKYRFYWEPQLFKQVFSHSGWMLFGTTANMLSTQGINMLMNIFFGVTVNAARAIAYQIQGAVNTFVSNFMMAVNPQIIKLYAQNDMDIMYKLVFRASRYSFYLFFVMALPVLMLTETFLTWWLKIVPEFAVLFTRLTIIDLGFTVFYGPLATINQATGKIKNYQLAITILFLTIFASTLIAYKVGMPSYTAFIIMIITSVIGVFMRLLIIKRQIQFSISLYIRNVLYKTFSVAILSIPLPLLLLKSFGNDFLQFIIVGLASVLSVTISVWVVGMEESERSFFRQKIKMLKSKYKRVQ
jgi:O-antigen/teichoic acid export membrane protein